LSGNDNEAHNVANSFLNAEIAFSVDKYYRFSL